MKRIEATALTHYRNDEATWFDTRIWNSELPELGWEAMYAFFRLLSGPEYERDGFPLDRLDEAIDSRELDVDAALESLLRAGAVVRDGDRLAFPNVIWGTPPEEESE